MTTIEVGLAEQVARLEDELAALRRRFVDVEAIVYGMLAEITTKKITVVDEDGFERIQIEAHDQYGVVKIHGKEKREGVDALDLALLVTEHDSEPWASFVIGGFEHNIVDLGVVVDASESAGNGIAMSSLTMHDVVNGEGNRHVAENSACFGPSTVRTSEFAIVKPELAS